MPLLQSGRNAIAALIISTGTPSGLAKGYSNTGCYFVVGDSTTAHAGSQTWMQGNSTMIGMDATYPQRSTNVLTFRATFTTAMANFAGGWREWGAWNATSTGDANANLLNRAVDTGLGTKTSSQTWQITADITITT
jgi:hypothetical protein